MFIGIMIIYFTLGTLQLSEIKEGVAGGLLKGGLLTASGLCLFMGAMGKSAQFPLHVWLPDAMEGPTPVSALIHAATMVVAGVYLVVRIFFLLTPEAMLTIAYIGGFTALFAATIALVQNDIKRVLAYSTISQLGYMMLALGVGSYTAGFFHLATQAAIKAGLFLGSGSVIHAMHHALHEAGSHDDPQDMRNMGGLRSKMPLTFWTFMISTLAISGVPFTSGFLSKDAILGGSLSFALTNPQHFLLPFFGFTSALLTAFYMFRLVFKTFFGEFRKGSALDHIHESPGVMVVPLLVLAILSTFIFFSINPFSPEGGWFFHIVHKPEQLAIAHIEEAHAGEGAAHTYSIVLSLVMAGIGILLSYLTYHLSFISAEAVAERFKGLYQALVKKWYMDDFYGAVVVKPAIALSRGLGIFDLKVIDGAVNGTGRLTVLLSWASGLFDNWVVDGAVNGVGLLTQAFGRTVRGLQTGKVQSYLALTVVGVLIIIVIRFLV
jgi:NADH-quinone oxidoreductase subunit L